MLTDKKDIQNWLKFNIWMHKEGDLSPNDVHIVNSQVHVPGDVNIGSHIRKLDVQFSSANRFRMSDKIQSLEGSPRKVMQFSADRSEISDLTGGPKYVSGTYYATNCPNLTSFRGGPAECKFFNAVGSVKFSSWDWDPTGVEHIHLSVNENTPLLRTICTQKVSLHKTFRVRSVGKLVEILNDPRWIGKGKVGAIPCAAELIKAGFGAHARW